MTLDEFTSVLDQFYADFMNRDDRGVSALSIDDTMLHKCTSFVLVYKTL